MSAATERLHQGTTHGAGGAEPALWGLVGNTPLIRVPAGPPAVVPSLLLKAEWLNPGGSVKDRAALFILRDGLARGELPATLLPDASHTHTPLSSPLISPPLPHGFPLSP